jgi:hypothetical protein
MLDHEGKGKTKQHTATNSYAEQRRIRGVNSHEYHANKRTGEKDSSHFTDMIIEVILVSICVCVLLG